MTAERRTFGPVAHYLPHRPPMLLIDEIVAFGGDQVICKTKIAPECVFAVDGRVHASAMIEFVAQACAIYSTLVAADAEAPARVGLIMGCREVTLDVDELAVGEELTITATRVYGHELMAAFTGAVHVGARRCATVQLSVVDAEVAGAGQAQDGEP
ncbi:MAG: hypothetical protein R3B48_03755 [Kofleriaceae bacterium]